MFDTPPPPLVQVRNLKMYFPIHTGVLRRHTGDVKAVDNVSFDIFPGETLGLVGESGCGKSTVGRALLRLYTPTAGSVVIDGEDVARLSPEALRQKRPQMQMVFQDPQASLNPRMTVADIIGEPLDEHTSLTKQEKYARIYELMDQVGLNRSFANRYPACLFGRPAAAHRHCPRPGPEPAIHRLRRTDRRAGCVHPGAGREPAGGAAGTTGPDLSVHQP
ncbi:MAG: ATP-binding cassette domain-containing protein [Gemmobacter sp.]|nr:ATP-binding cassette domain-containing protein [Gemmobacter sp.]